MLMKATLLLIAAFSMSGCVPAAIVYGGSRSEAKQSVKRVVTERYPNVSADAAAECALAGMTYGEILSLGNSTRPETAPERNAKVDSVIKRPGVAACIAALPKTAATK